MTLKPAFIFRSNKLFFIWENRDRLIVWVLVLHIYLDGGNSNIFKKSPLFFGEDGSTHFDLRIFFKPGVGENPPTRYVLFG